MSAELYTTNGDVTDDALRASARRPTRSSSTAAPGPDVGGTVDGPDSFTPGGFVFQDSEADIQAEFQKNLAFALDLARSAKDPDNPVSHLGNTAPDFVPTTFPISYGDPQTVEVNAKKSLGAVACYWQVNGGCRALGARRREYKGGERRYDDARRLLPPPARPRSPARTPGDSVKVWFQAGQQARSISFTYKAKSESRQQGAADGGRGLHRAELLGAGPARPGSTSATTRRRCRTRGIGFDVYDVDAREPHRADPRSACSRTTRPSSGRPATTSTCARPGQPGGTGKAKLLDDEVIAARDYMNDGGKLLVAGQHALQGGVGPVPLQPARPTPPRPVLPVQPDAGPGRRRRPAGPELQLRRRLERLPAVLARGVPADHAQRRPGRRSLDADSRTPPLGTTHVHAQRRRLGAEPGQPLLVPDDVEHPARRRRTRSSRAEPAIKRDGPPAFDPPTGTQLRVLRSGELGLQAAHAHGRPDGQGDGADAEVQGLLRHGAGLRLRVRGGAHRRPGRLDDAARHERAHERRRRRRAARIRDPFWLNENPFLSHYITRTGTRRRRRLHADRDVRRVERGDRQLRRLPGLGDRPERLHGQAGRGLDHLRDRPGGRSGSACSSTTRRSSPTAHTLADDLVRGRRSAAGRCRARPPTAARNGDDWIRRTSRRLRRRTRRRARSTRSTGASASRA